MESMSIRTKVIITSAILIYCIMQAGCIGPKGTTLSGTVVDKQGKGLAGIRIGVESTFFGPSYIKRTILTDANGRWQLSNIKSTTKLTPLDVTYKFTPPNTVILSTTHDFTFVGIAAYSASGTIKDGNNRPIDNVSITVEGEATDIITGSNGQWQASSLTLDHMITPHKQGWLFSPTKAIVTSQNPVADFIAYRGVVVGDFEIDKIGEFDSPTPGQYCKSEVEQSDGGNGKSMHVVMNCVSDWIQWSYWLPENVYNDQYTKIRFLLKGKGDGTPLGVRVEDLRGHGWDAQINDTFSGWKMITLPLSAFTPAPNAPEKMDGFRGFTILSWKIPYNYDLWLDDVTALE